MQLKFFPHCIDVETDGRFFIATGQSGVALFLVLWILLILTVIVGQFCYGIRVETKITTNFKESTQAYYIAHAGLMSAIDFLINSQGAVWKVKKAGSKTTETDKAEVSTWRINSPSSRKIFGNGAYEVFIENESGKININKADAALLKLMLGPFEITNEEKKVIVASILDWRDRDRRHRLHGAEYNYYESLPTPYACRDGDFETIDELLLVRGITGDMFYGGLRDIVTVKYINPFKGLPDWQLRELQDKGIKNIGYDYNKININAASSDVLALLPGMTKVAIDAIAAYRRMFDFKNMSELKAVVGNGAYVKMFRYVTLDSIPFYRIYAWGGVGMGGLNEGLEVLVEISNGNPRSYEIYEWKDRVEETLTSASTENDADLLTFQ